MEYVKTCISCNVEKPISEFYRHKQMGDGHLNKCKACTKRDVKNNRCKKLDYYREYDRNRKNKEERANQRKEHAKWLKENDYEKYINMKRNSLQKFREKYPEKAHAHQVVSDALISGKLKKEPCIICGSLVVEAHHEDYSKPLYVVWLCSKHHHERHVEKRRLEREANLS